MGGFLGLLGTIRDGQSAFSAAGFIGGFLGGGLRAAVFWGG